MEPSKPTKVITEVICLLVMAGIALLILALILRAIDIILEPVLIIGR